MPMMKNILGVKAVYEAADGEEAVSKYMQL